MKGFVDNTRGENQLGGWVRDSKNDGRIDVLVLRDGSEIGSGVNELERADQNGEFGFNIVCTEPLREQDVREGRLKVVARSSSATLAELTILPAVLLQLKRREVGLRLHEDPEALLETLKVAAAKIDGNSPPLMAKIRDVLPWLEAPPVAGPLGTIGGGRTSEFSLEVGFQSPDKVVVVGEEGHLFLWSGSNDLARQYARGTDEPDIKQRAEAWQKLFQTRAAELERRNITYFQFILPEKLSVVGEYAPTPILSQTSLLKALETLIAEDPALGKVYASALDVIRASPSRLDIYRKIDTHLSAIGAKLIFDFLLSGANCPAFLPDVPMDEIRLLGGDLGDRFFGAPLVEKVRLPSGEALAALDAAVVVVENFAPPRGGHVGRRLVWSNVEAPDKRRVVVFGNSFFERGGAATGLSWWAARCFSEFHMLWEADFDFEYLDAVKPDLVVGQTIERFLPLLAKV